MPKEAAVLVKKTLNSGFLAEGKVSEEFRCKVASFIGNKRCILTNSCTTALTIAFKIAGVSPGAEVITTPLTCIAGNQSILALGGTPIWADIDRETGMITKETIPKRLPFFNNF